MKTKGIDRYLLQHAFFQGLSVEDLTVIAGCGKNVVFAPNEVIFREGEPATIFYVIRAGHIAVELPAPVGGSITIQTLNEGDVLGWSWLLPPHQWQYSARAIDQSRAIALDGACLRKKCEHNTAMGYELMKRFSEVMVERLKATRLQLMDLYGKTVQGPMNRP